MVVQRLGREGSGNARQRQCLIVAKAAGTQGTCGVLAAKAARFCVVVCNSCGVAVWCVAVLRCSAACHVPAGDHAARCGEGAPERDQVPTLRVAAGETSVILPHPPLPVVGVSTGGEEGVSAKMTVSPWLPAGRTRTESRARRRSRCSAPSRRREFCHSAAPHLSLSWAF